MILDNGKDVLPYEKLILAPGGTPRRLPIEGSQLENVFTFRGIEDAKRVESGWSYLLLISFAGDIAWTYV